MVRTVHKFHGARLLSLRALAGSNEEGDHVLENSPPRVLSQPWGRKGDVQLPALWAQTLSSSLGACCWGSPGCREAQRGG